MIFEIDFETGKIESVGGDILSAPPPNAVVLDHWKMNADGVSEDEAWILDQLRQAAAIGARGMRLSVWFRHNSARVGVKCGAE